MVWRPAVSEERVKARKDSGALGELEFLPTTSCLASSSQFMLSGAKKRAAGLARSSMTLSCYPGTIPPSSIDDHPPFYSPITCTHPHQCTRTHTPHSKIFLGVEDKKDARNQSEATPNYHFIPQI